MCIFSHCSFFDYYHAAIIIIFPCMPNQIILQDMLLFHVNCHIIILRILNILFTNKGIAYFEFIITLIYYHSLILHSYSLFKLGKSDDVTIILLKNCSDVE